MRKKWIHFLVFTLVLLFSCESFANVQLEMIFQQLYNQVNTPQFADPVRIYGVSHDYSTICFIAGTSVYLFGNGEIHRVNHAKVFPVSGINRIHYQSNSTGGFFELWSNEKRILTIGAP